MIPNSSASRNWRPKSQGWKGPWGAKRGTGFFRRCLAQDQGDTPAEKHLWRDSIYSEIRRGVQAQGGISIVRMCELAVVSRAGFYRQWEQQEPCEAEMALRDAIQRQALAHRFYGYRRVAVLVQREGYGVGTKKVRRLMQEDNLLALRRRKFVATTDSDHGFVVYPNLAQYLILTEVNQLWVADMTYLRLEGEFVYLAVVLDAFSYAAQSFRNTVELAQHAERLRYRRYWLAEHHNMQIGR